MLLKFSHLSAPTLGSRKKRVWVPVLSTGIMPTKETMVNRVTSLETVNLVRSRAKDSDLIVALSSGTVNDICKYASYLEGKNYISFPTAASMNGYTSSNASILVDGYKKFLVAHLPRAIYIDTNIITNAPLRLTLSGLRILSAVQQCKLIGYYLIYYLARNIMNCLLYLFVIWRKLYSESIWHLQKKAKR